jgi:hypothetical protein
MQDGATGVAFPGAIVILHREGQAVKPTRLVDALQQSFIGKGEIPSLTSYNNVV